MICPHINKACPYVNTSGMSKTKECNECKYYINKDGIRATGSMPILGWIVEKLNL